MATIYGTTKLGDYQVGTSKADTFYGSTTADEFSGAGGNDRIEGKAGNDALIGGRGADLIYGGQGNDLLVADGDYFYALEPSAQYGDRMEGGTGRDRLATSAATGSWCDMTGGLDADTFDVTIVEYAQAFPDLHSWVDIRDFRAGEGDKLYLSLLYSDTNPGLSSAATLDFFDSTGDGRLTNADDAVVWAGGALRVSSETATIVLWGVDHIDSSMLIA